jgi:hypothetical protein
LFFNQNNFQMKNSAKIAAICLLIHFLFLFFSCGSRAKFEQAKSNSPSNTTARQTVQNENSHVLPPVNTPDKTPENKHETTNSPIGQFDFKNHTYPLPRGWQDQDSKNATLENGVREMTKDKIGLSLVNVKYLELTGDQSDEAIVTLKIETGGSAVPKVVYIFGWDNGEPNLIWSFRTGDRADGGLKSFSAENGMLVVELYGQDRYIFGQVETLRVVGDEEDLCCPTYFTRTHYKWNGKTFVLQGNRETLPVKQEKNQSN